MSISNERDNSYNTQCAWQDWTVIEAEARGLLLELFAEKLRPHDKSICEQIELQTFMLKELLRRKVLYDEALEWLNNDQLEYDI